MEKINSIDDLYATISKLELQRDEDLELLKEEARDKVESIKPINLLKNTLREAVASDEIKQNLLTVSLGLAAGFLAKKLIARRNDSTIKKIAAAAIQLGLTRLIVQHPEVVSAIGQQVLRVFSPRSSDEYESE